MIWDRVQEPKPPLKKWYGTPAFCRNHKDRMAFYFRWLAWPKKIKPKYYRPRTNAWKARIAAQQKPAIKRMMWRRRISPGYAFQMHLKETGNYLR